MHFQSKTWYPDQEMEASNKKCISSKYKYNVYLQLNTKPLNANSKSSCNLTFLRYS